MTRTGNIRKFTLALALGGSTLGYTAPASADGVEPYIGQLIQVGFNYCPVNYVQASGQLIPIQTNTALFSLIGTTYGGNGTTNFQLPNLNGRAAVHLGQGPGLSPYQWGQQTGSETTTLTTANMAAHTHRVAAQTANAQANSTTANGNAIGISSNNSFVLPPPDPSGNLMDGSVIQVAPTGNSIPVSNRPPYLTMKWCMARFGIFPSRN